MIVKIDDGIRLEVIAKRHAEDLYFAIDNNRTHLSAFLPWVSAIQSVDDFRAYIKKCELLYQQHQEVSFAIMRNEVAVGRIGLHYINHLNKVAAIGYWLTKEAEGKGIITKSCKAIVKYGFEELSLHRIEIKVATENLKSQAIPERLKFKKEGLLRQAEFVNNKFVDLFIYSMLAFEWKDETI